MDLVLDREYFPGGTNGVFLLDGKILCYCIEAPSDFFRQGISCIPEGIYELDLISNKTSKEIRLFNCPNGIRSHESSEVAISTRNLDQNIILVSEITGEGMGKPSKKAETSFLHLIEQALKKGEKVTLEIRSCPDNALNLTCHQIEWMD
ncbi:DUF5675 family protein [Algoriphagus pacificus]|uniref:DUF5675 domain-containing protein n=1 Tax=Algoriphagus pacificus TaxID=2811234 RepID=A0ABS3CEY0_9BACT|nr:DUF5675 family protein [Algoriphagus pacificus]MBN7814711.1 hypothetical protein [Algoriphagus pacificus]